MKNSPSALSISILIFATLGFLAGCVGLTENPAPNPTPTPTPAAHGPFVFVSASSGNAPATDGFRLNPDGTLTSIPGSPFPFGGDLAVSGSFLMATGGTLTSYRVDPGSGTPVPVDKVPIQFADALAADAKNVYVTGMNDLDAEIYAFNVGPSGALTPVPGSPYLYGVGCLDAVCPIPIIGRMAVNDAFFAMAEIGYHGSGGLVVLPRDSNGALQRGHEVGLSDQDRVALPHPAGNVIFSSDSASIDGLTSYLLDPSGNPTRVASLPMDSGITDETMDPTGKFLLGLDGNGVVHVFTVNSTTAEFSEISASESAGKGAIVMAMDPSGRFVIVAQASNQGIPEPPDQITVFAFDAASGAMRKLQSYPVGKLPFRIAVIAE
jgi:hypothetical protein